MMHRNMARSISALFSSTLAAIFARCLQIVLAFVGATMIAQAQPLPGHPNEPQSSVTAAAAPRASGALAEATTRGNGVNSDAESRDQQNLASTTALPKYSETPAADRSKVGNPSVAGWALVLLGVVLILTISWRRSQPMSDH